MLLAIGRVHDVAHGSLRLILCEWNTDEDVDRILAAMPEVVAYLRDMSPMCKDIGVKATKTCCSLEDVEDARLVALRLGIPYYVFNFSDDFKGGRSSTASSRPTSAAQHRTPASTATAI